MFGLSQSGLRSASGGPEHTSERPAYDDAFSDYEDTPYLTGLVNLCFMIGVFVGIWTVILLLGDLHRGIASYWSLLLILAVDLWVNIAARVARARRRRDLSLERSERMEHVSTQAPKLR